MLYIHCTRVFDLLVYTKIIYLVAGSGFNGRARIKELSSEFRFQQQIYSLQSETADRCSQVATKYREANAPIALDALSLTTCRTVRNNRRVAKPLLLGKHLLYVADACVQSVILRTTNRRATLGCYPLFYSYFSSHVNRNK